MNRIRFYSIGIFLALTFFIVGILTLSDYGLNIDEPIHFIRGQAYLKMLTSGENAYSSGDLSGKRVSAYKIQQYNAKYFLKNDSGHPPLGGILAALFNVIFYEKLGVLGDLESYHLFEILISSFLVLLVYVMVRKRYGIFAAIMSSLSLILYPLFLGESHFNIKDPIETTFYAFTIYFFYLAIEYRKMKYFIISASFFGLAFSTKFNALFLPFTLLPYLIIRYWAIVKRQKIKIIKIVPLKIYFYLILFPIIGMIIQFISRPYLWSDPLGRFMQIAGYYKDIGTGQFSNPKFLVGGWNMYAPVFIFISTPIYTLFLLFVGVVYGFFKLLKEKDKFFLLIFLWMIVPIARVMYPGTNIYSGVRQIMEYIPAMAILTGIGANHLVQSLRSKIVNLKPQLSTFILELLIISLFVPTITKLIYLHPNESLFINYLVGGLKGAYEKKIPGAGESMGNAYLQGLKWLNNHAEKDAKYQLSVGMASNVPTQFSRKDLKLGPYFSGLGMRDEYVMEMISVDFPPARYSIEYLNRYLNPVYEDKVDGAAILKIWRNDKKYVKKGYLNEKEEKGIRITGDIVDGVIEISLREPSYVTRLEIEYDNKNCKQERSGLVAYGLDKNGMSYAPDNLSASQGLYASALQKDNLLVYLFAAYPAKYIRLILDNQSACLLQHRKITVKGLRDVKPPNL